MQLCKEIAYPFCSLSRTIGGQVEIGRFMVTTYGEQLAGSFLKSLFHASQNGKLEFVRYLIEEIGCDIYYW